jgi:hypothetical protein
LIFAAGFVRVAAADFAVALARVAAGFAVALARVAAGFLRVFGVAVVRLFVDAGRPRAGVGLSIYLLSPMV